MEAHLGGPDSSLNASLTDEEDGEYLDLLPDDSPNPEDVIGYIHDTEARSRWLGEALGTLDERERKIIVKRFLNEDKRTLAEIGEDFGVSKERIRQIEAKALGKLRTALTDHGENADDLLSLAGP